MRSACLHAAGHVHWRWFAGTILEVASVSEFEKDLRKKKEGTDTLNQNQENSTKPAVPAEGENNAPAAPAKKRIAAVYRPQNSTQKRPAGNRQQGGQRPARQNNGSGMQVRPTTNSARQNRQRQLRLQQHRHRHRRKRRRQLRQRHRHRIFVRMSVRFRTRAVRKDARASSPERAVRSRDATETVRAEEITARAAIRQQR